MRLLADDIHIWTANLADKAAEQTHLALLQADEVQRANRLRLPEHRQRFIVARSLLRQLLSLYLHLPPTDIPFAYTDKGKPYLAMQPQPLHFNVAHSHDMAVYAFSLNSALGVDIEKIKDDYKPGIIERFFSPDEQAALNKLPEPEKRVAFYRVWARKEALLKANGKGLSIPLSAFSVSISESQETVSLENTHWTLVPLDLHPHYQSALACEQKVTSLLFWRFFEHGTAMDKRYNL